MKKIGVITGGGDCPGLNAVLRGIVVKAVSLGIEVYGFRRGWQGLMDSGEYVKLESEDVEDILILGGTILRTSRANPFAHKRGPEQIRANLERVGCQALIVIGGPDILWAANKLAAKHNLKLVAVPKTVQNSLPGTDYTFGFLSAVNVATDAIDRLHTTARSYGRCLVVETTGQKVGWVALFAGLAGGAHTILLPEFPFDLKEVCQVVRQRKKEGKEYTIVVMAEGAHPADLKGFKVKSRIKDEYGNELVSGASDWLASQIQKKTKVDTRSVILSSILRGGSPTNYDRMLGLRFGVKAVELVAARKFGMMASLQSADITAVLLKNVAGKLKKVPVSLYKGMKLFLG